MQFNPSICEINEYIQNLLTVPLLCIADATLDRDEEYLLHNLTAKPEQMQMPDQYDPMEVDCGLISILLAICYDVR